MMDSTRAGTYETTPFNIDSLREAISKIKSIPKNDEWVIINPQGEMYSGTIEQIMPILIREHPLMKTPLYSNMEMKL
jgi:hypothetical protein